MTKNPTYLHLSYLQQLSDLLEDKHKTQAARLNYIAKQICEKHVVHISGYDPPKLKRCKACQAPILSDDLLIENKMLVKKCSLCGFKRRYGIHKRGAANMGKNKTVEKQPTDAGEDRS